MWLPEPRSVWGEKKNKMAAIFHACRKKQPRGLEDSLIDGSPGKNCSFTEIWRRKPEKFDFEKEEAVIKGCKKVWIQSQKNTTKVLRGKRYTRREVESKSKNRND